MPKLKLESLTWICCLPFTYLWHVPPRILLWHHPIYKRNVYFYNYLFCKIDVYLYIIRLSSYWRKIYASFGVCKCTVFFRFWKLVNEYIVNNCVFEYQRQEIFACRHTWFLRIYFFNYEPAGFFKLLDRKEKKSE